MKPDNKEILLAALRLVRLKISLSHIWFLISAVHELLMSRPERPVCGPLDMNNGHMNMPMETRDQRNLNVDNEKLKTGLTRIMICSF